MPRLKKYRWIWGGNVSKQCRVRHLLQKSITKHTHTHTCLKKENGHLTNKFRVSESSPVQVGADVIRTTTSVTKRAERSRLPAGTESRRLEAKEKKNCRGDSSTGVSERGGAKRSLKRQRKKKKKKKKLRIRASLLRQGGRDGGRR